MNKTFNIALVGNAPADKRELLNSILDEEGLQEMCDIALYGADGQPEQSALNDAINDYRDGVIDGIVCLPMATPLKTAVADVMGDEARDAMPLYIHSTSRIAAVTTKQPNDQTTSLPNDQTLTQDAIVARATMLSKTLKRDLSILNPRIAVTSLADEISTEDGSADITTIAPAISELVKSGIQVFGPIAAGKLYEGEGFMAFDAVLTMYDGQCMEPFMLSTNEATVALLAGVEIPIAQTEAEGLIAATGLVMDAARNRKEYDTPFANPLPKLYHDRKEDGDKARFAVKKKGFNPAEHRRENVTYIKAPANTANGEAATAKSPTENNTQREAPAKQEETVKE